MSTYDDSIAEKNDEKVGKLIDQFSDSQFFNLIPEKAKEEAGFVIQCVADFMYSYELETIDSWTAESLEYICIDILPRKVSAELSFFRSIVPVLKQFIRFTANKKIIANENKLIEILPSIEKDVEAKASDSSNWGLAKSLFCQEN